MELVDKAMRDIVIHFLDLSKAFGKLDHIIFLKKLYHYEIIGVYLKWFSSYIGDRIQHVTYNYKKSHSHKITTGVPQGSVLGPLLSII